jgi:hypothetical protein
MGYREAAEGKQTKQVLSEWNRAHGSGPLSPPGADASSTLDSIRAQTAEAHVIYLEN